MTRLEELVVAGRRISERTKALYLQAVRSFQAFARADPANWTPNTVEGWLQHLRSTHHAPQTINQMLTGLRYASRRRAQMDDVKHFAQPVERFRVGGAINPNRALPPSEAVALLTVVPVDGDWMQVRDRAMFLLGLRGGLRRNEIVQTRWSKLQDCRLAFVGKGGLARAQRLDDATCAALGAWKRIAPKGTDFAFVRMKRRIVGVTEPLTTDGFYKILKRRAKEAGVIGKLSPHTLRHTCATLLELAGVPPHLIQQHLGHRGGAKPGELNPTTARYIHVDRPISDALDKVLRG